MYRFISRYFFLIFLLLSSASLSCAADDDRLSKKEKNNIVTRLAKKIKDKKEKKRRAKKIKNFKDKYQYDKKTMADAYFCAIAHGDYEKVHEFLDVDRELFVSYKCKRDPAVSPLQWAVNNANTDEHFKIVQELIEAGCSLKNDDCIVPCSILLHPLLHGNTRIVELLLAHGADPNAEQSQQKAIGLFYWYPLMYVQKSEDAKLLLEAGAYIDKSEMPAGCTTYDLGITPIMKHIQTVNKEVVYFLMQQGASMISPNHKDGFVSRHNALYHAMVNNREDVNSMFIMGRWLLHAGAFFKILNFHIGFGDIDGGSDLYRLDQCNQLLLEYSKKFPRVLSLQNLARNVIREQAPKNEQLRNNANHLPAIVFQYTEEVKEDLQHWPEGYVPLQLPYGYESTGAACD